jgi:predicted lipoprotein
MKSVVNKIIILIVVFAALFFSVKIKKLNNANNGKVAKFEINNYWSNTLIATAKQSKTITQTIQLLISNAKQFIATASKSKSNDSIHLFLANDSGVILEKSNKLLTVKTTDTSKTINLNIENYFGNALRDVSGIYKIENFENQLAFNEASANLNKKLNTEVLYKIKNDTFLNRKINFQALIEYNSNSKKTNVIPINYQLQ